MVNKYRHRNKYTLISYDSMIEKTKAEFHFKFSIKRFAQKYYFQKSSWLLFPGSPANYLTHKFPVTAFRENFNVMSYYAEDTMVL